MRSLLKCSDHFGGEFQGWGNLWNSFEVEKNVMERLDIWICWRKQFHICWEMIVVIRDVSLTEISSFMWWQMIIVTRGVSITEKFYIEKVRYMNMWLYFEEKRWGPNWAMIQVNN